MFIKSAIWADSVYKLQCPYIFNAFLPPLTKVQCYFFQIFVCFIVPEFEFWLGATLKLLHFFLPYSLDDLL